MVYKYQRKTPRQDENQLRLAIAAVQSGMPVKAASRRFGVPRTSLLRHVRNNAVSEAINEPADVS